MAAPEDGLEQVGAAPARLHWPALLAGLAIMAVGSIDPRLFSDGGGKADHALAGLAMWAMSAGLVRGVGFVPSHQPARVLLSGWACLAGALGAVGWRVAH